MKWVYVPIMFALAFIYTKTTLNSNEPEETSPRRITRGPASEPIETQNINLKRVPAANLYKSFGSNALTPFTQVTSFEGVIVGNVHADSFGFIQDDRKKASLGIIEFDEVTEGAFFHDVFSHLISVKNLDKKISWMNYFEYYKSGLMDLPHTNSYYVEKGIEEAGLEAEKLLEENITPDFPVEFKKLAKTHQHLDAVKKSQIQNEIKKIYPKVQFFDLYQSNLNGGNYQALIRIRPVDKIQWVVINENSKTHYDQFFNKEQLVEFQTRQQLIKNIVYDNKMDSSLKSFKIGRSHFVLSFKENFASKIKWEQIPEDDYHDCLMDQAYLLGKIHRRSLDTKVDSYIKAWAKIPAAIIDEKAVELKFKLRDQVQ